MRIGSILFGVVGTLVAAGGAAQADRTMVVVIDASGSMQGARFGSAKTMARQRVIDAAGEVQGLASVAVYTLQSSGVVAHTGFVSPNGALQAIEELAVTRDLTPLAGSLCDAIDIASASGTGATQERLLEVFSDGGENSTAATHACFGTFSQTAAPFDFGSWQNKVHLRGADSSPRVTISLSLFTDVSSLRAGGARAAESAVTDEQFFAILAADTGGVFEKLEDGAPLPGFTRTRSRSAPVRKPKR